MEAGLRQLWRSPQERYPEGQEQAVWEVWLDPTDFQHFQTAAPSVAVIIHGDKLEFPEDVVVLVTATPAVMAQAVRTLKGIRALAAPTTTAEFFDNLEIEEQVGWVNELLGRTTYNPAADANYVTMLDTGISLGHPLIQPALSGADRHAAEPAWGPEDNHGHGTQLAGLALFGDLQLPLQSELPVEVRHRLESAKILPNVGENPYHLYGAITRRGVNAAENNGNRRRTFALATTTGADNPHDGAPTSWSSAIDQLCAGVAGDKKIARLFTVSAGNTDQNSFGNDEYLATCDLEENEIESPAQAWNAVCVGAYTEKCLLPVGEGTPLAPAGDLSPCSRTASWFSHWPIKPDVVLEGGNWVVSGPPPPMGHQALLMLTTTREFPQRAFTTCGDTSGATALAARALSEIWTDYPDLWPETIRALFVGSARWTSSMRSHLPANPAKGDYTPIFRRYGYGVPDLQRARRSASNAVCLIVEDTITPYRKSDKKHSPHIHNEMKIFNLPWPAKELRRLGQTMVTLRVTLSTFIEPNPSEVSRGSKFGYASHNLRFKLKRANENEAQFLARISKAAEQAEEEIILLEDDGWDFGRNRRDVGSLHIDQLTCRASDLARRHTLAVFPVTGWWKTQKSIDPKGRVAHFSLIVEIDAEELKAELYSEVAEAIAASNAVVL